MRWLELAVSVFSMSLPAILVRYAEASVEALGFWRMVLAIAALAPLAWPRRGAWAALGRGDRLIVGAAGFLFFVHLWLYTFAARHTTVAHCMLAFSAHPPLAALGARIFFGHPLRRRVLAGFALAIAGIAVLASGAAAGHGTLIGDLASVASAAAFSGYVLCGQRARRKLDNWTYAVPAYAVCGACFLIAGLARGSAFTGYSSRGWTAIAALGFGVTVLGHALFTRLFEHVEVHLLNQAKLFEPLVGAAIARVVFGEPVTSRTALAFVLLGAAFALSAAPSRR